ncbi:type 2 lanthipeptide synthetase LanM family protein (plasmid) [Corynebacterium sp. S7]
MLSKTGLFEAFFSSERQEGHFSDAAIQSWKGDFYISDTRWHEYLNSRETTERSFSSALTSTQAKDTDDGWIETLNAVLSGPYTTPVCNARPRYGAQQLDHLPFEPFFGPFINYYIELIKRRIPNNLTVASDCLQSIVDDLSSELFKEGFLCVLDWYKLSGMTRDEYDNVFRFGNGHAEIFTRYPVLPRALIKAAEDFTALVLTILFHFENDWSELSKVSLVQGVSPRIDDLRSGLGDKHEAKTVCRLTIEDNELYFRPRSAPEFQLYNDIVYAIGAEKWLPHVEHLNFSDHCWVRGYQIGSVAHLASDDHIYRLGLLGAIFHSLGSKDMHFENIIATSAGPVPVDLETIIAPQPAARTHRSDELAQLLINDSPLGTGIFPVGSSISGGELEVSSLFGGLKTTDVSVEKIIFDDSGDIFLIPEKQTSRPSNSSLNGMSYQDVVENSSCALEGLKKGLELVNASEKNITFLVDSYRDQPVRVLLRPTAIYDMTLRVLRHPTYMRSMLSRERFLLRLWQKVDDQPFELSPAQIYSEEKQLLEGNVPYFTVQSSSLDSRDQFEMTPLERARHQILRACSPASLVQDVGFVRESIASAAGIQPPADLLMSDSFADPHPEVVAEIADSIFQKFIDQAILSGEDVTWLGFTSSTEGGSVRLSPLGTGMYDGLSGIAVGLSSYFRVSGDLSARELVRMIIDSLQHEVRLLDASPFTPIGAFSGLSGILYAIHFAETMIGDPSSLSSRESEDAWVTRLSARVEEDTYLDLTSGSAGALSVVCSLVENGVWTTKQSQDLIRLLQKKLLSSAYQRPGLIGRGWPTGNAEVMLGGFSHGSAGIATSLARSNRICRDTNVGFCVQEGIIFDDNFISPETGLWIDQRPEFGNEEVVSNQWCHGAAGITLARSLINKWREGDSYAGLMEAAVDNSSFAPVPQNFSLCHGLFGNAYCLKEIDEQMFSTAFNLSFDALLNNGFRAGLSFDIQSVPGLMTGLSGVLYALSAYLDRRIPNVLWLE